MSNFMDPNNDYLFQDDLFDDLLNDLVYDDLGGDLVTFPAAEFTVEDGTVAADGSNASKASQGAISQPQNVEAAIPVTPPVPVISSSSSNGQNNNGRFNQVTENTISKGLNYNSAQTQNAGSKHPSNSSVTQSSSSKKNKKEKEAETAASVNATIQRIRTLTLLPILIFKAFNGGDLPKVREIIREVTTKDCWLKTPALDTPISGQNNVIDLFQAIYDAHPDAVWVAKQCKLNEETNVIQCRVYFAGTRIAPIYKSSAADNLHDSNHADYLYKKRNSSLLDEMDVNLLSPPEIESMRELEKLSRNLSVFFKGTLDLEVDHTNADKIKKFDFDWTITSFREADL